MNPLHRDWVTLVADLGSVCPAAKDHGAIMRSERELAAQLPERETFNAAAPSARHGDGVHV